MILKYLIPVKLSIGILPKDWLLEKYNLVEVQFSLSFCLYQFFKLERVYCLIFLPEHDQPIFNFIWNHHFMHLTNNILLLQYKNVVEALKRGDLRLLRHALQEHEDRYVSELHFKVEF